MKIGILGSGNMAEALGTQWIAAGHEVMLGGRNPAARAEKIGAGHGTFAEAASYGDVVLLAVLIQAVPEVLAQVGDRLRGKPLLDPTNAPTPDQYDVNRPLAPWIAQLSGAHVVKAFNTCHVDVWRLTPPVFDGRPLVVPLAGDDPGALAVARELVACLGCTPVEAGGLDRVVLLEAMTAFMISLWWRGVDAQAVLPPV